ncbi:DUF362 domain-containing protein [Defluviitalea phaphyphila]|uniref:DUF362 domain-containing protein n=1 Tax=Defluviitalea phaphyphila TaxID=1473580 RepID=UPI00073063C4|nr:DUF362 domain-containing protein [Defluviitalea phaphyphila]
MDKNQIHVIYGNTPKTMVGEILEKIKPEKEIPKKAYIGIKPNLVVAKPSTSGATTSPELVEGIIEYFYSKGYKNICILEGSWVGDRTAKAFKVCGYENISKKYKVPLIDLQKDSHIECTVDDIKINICSKVSEIDYLINVPVLKGHCQTNITCALKNLKGCIPNSEKRRYHTMGLHKPIAYLNKAIKQDLIIVDGIMGDLNFEEGGNPVEMNRIIVGCDPVLIDSYAATLLGFDLSDIPYIEIAEEIGVGNSDISNAEIIELNSDKSTPINRKSKKRRYTEHIEEKEACSACYGTLIHAMERLRESGDLRKVNSKIYIGQYYKNKTINDGVGIGQCTKGCKECIPGCPPTARDIVKYFKNL